MWHFKCLVNNAYEKAGFKNRDGKGSHRHLIHAKGITITVSGRLGEDAKKYQENEVKRKMLESSIDGIYTTINQLLDANKTDIKSQSLKLYESGKIDETTLERFY